MNRRWLATRATFLSFSTMLLCVGVTRHVEAQNSSWVRYGQGGRLIYQMDHRGDRLLDYSAAGFKEGTPIPIAEDVIEPNRFLRLTPTAGDNLTQIQTAIDQVSALPLNAHGYRGIVQLEAGRYDISDTLRIGASGVILRGVGDDSSESSNTILHSTSTAQISMIEVGNFDQYANDLFNAGSVVDILDEVVPAGVNSFRVANTVGFSVGDWINIKRTPTQAWFDYVTSHFAPDPSGENLGWNTSEDRFTFQHERRITRIEGDRIFIHAPLSHSIDPRSSGTIEHYTDRRVSNVGIEGIRGTSVFDASETGVYDGRTQYDDEDHAENFVKFLHAEDSWAKDITGEHLVHATVILGSINRSITVEDARYVSPVSVITGGRRYAFNMNGGQFILMHDLAADSARRAFVNNSTFNGFNRGPNVFFDGVSANGFVRSGPHANYSTGALYDNLTDDSGFEARRAVSDSVHGWRGGHTVIWNSHSPVFQIASPPGANNYLIGATGGGTSPDPAGAMVDSFEQRVLFSDAQNPLDSLYVAQKLEQQRFPLEESREYWVGDFDELSPGDAADQVYVDPAWLTAIDSLSSSFHSSQPVTGFDDDSFGHRVPFTIEYDLAPDEVVVSAVLTLGMKRRGGASSDDDRLWIDSTANPLEFTTEGWGPLFENSLQVLTLEFAGDLTFLQDGQLNGVLSNNRALDWAHLLVNVVDQSLLASSDSDFDGDVDGADFLHWQRTDPSQLANWQLNYGTGSLAAAHAIPEPNSIALAGLLAVTAVAGYGRRRS